MSKTLSLIFASQIKLQHSGAVQYSSEAHHFLRSQCLAPFLAGEIIGAFIRTWSENGKNRGETSRMEMSSMIEAN